VGTLIGGFAFSNLLAALFLAVGAGAILQVIYEVGKLLLKDSTQEKGDQAPSSLSASLSATNLAGLAVGVALMYTTGLLVAV
jgi:hypothetical protein